VLFDVCLFFHSFRQEAVDDAQDPMALLGLGDDYLYRIGGGAVDVADLGNGLDCTALLGVRPQTVRQIISTARTTVSRVCSSFS